MWLFVVVFLGTDVLLSPAAAVGTAGREQDGLVGPVHTVITEMAQLTRENGQWKEEGRVRVNVSVYDVKGNLIEKLSYHPDGVPATRTVRVYDSAGKLVQETATTPDGVLWRTARYSYDATGRLRQVAHYAADGSLLFTDAYTHDAQGNLVEFVSLEPNGTPLRKSVYAYGSRGEVSEHRLYDAADSHPTARTTYTYDTVGRLRELATYGRTGALSSTWVYAYDARGNQSEWVVYQPDGTVAQKQTYTYEYDTRGNWVKKVVSELITPSDAASLEPSEVIYRTITYHLQAAQ
ncbi:MAG: hypothetical protein NZ578_09540 [Candidatus Binatia bacterium]|nr:hypothetical protein [Candidatus Binatia bacterium]